MIRKAIGWMAIASLPLIFGACSTAQNAIRNDAAANCASPAAMQAFVNSLPPSLLTGAQQLAVQEQICHAMFGDVAAPATAAGNAPAIPGAPTPAPSAAPTAVPAHA